jgi:hypothetical protein
VFSLQKIIGGVCGNNRFHKSGDIILILNMVKSHFFHKLYRHCTGFSEYVLRQYDSKQMALGEPKHALWQFWNPSIFDGINQKKDKKEDIYVLLFDESLIQQLKKNQLDIQAILELSYQFK